MNKIVETIILNHTKGKTSDEQDAEMVKLLEKKFNTGPIIGDAKEVLLSMSRNIMVRDMLLDSMGMPITQREKFFGMINEMLDKKDKEILEERRKGECKNG